MSARSETTADPFDIEAHVAASHIHDLYRFRSTGDKKAASVKLLGSGAIMNEVLRAQDMLKNDYGVDTEAWVATSYQQLHREGLDVERWNRMHPDSGPRVSHTEACLGQEADGLVVATSDYMKTLPCSIRPWIAGTFVGLGTDGFGRSDGRVSLRDYFEVDARHIAFATL